MQAVVELSQSTVVRLNVGGKVFTTLRETLHGSVFLNDLFAEVTRGRLRFPTDEWYQANFAYFSFSCPPDSIAKFLSPGAIGMTNFRRVCYLCPFAPAHNTMYQATRSQLVR